MKKLPFLTVREMWGLRGGLGEGELVFKDIKNYEVENTKSIVIF